VRKMLISIKKNKFLIILFIVMLMIIMLIWNGLSNLSVSVSAGVSNWGLKFNEEGSVPIGNASIEFLRKYNAYYVGDTENKYIYLTFDAGLKTETHQVYWIHLRNTM